MTHHDVAPTQATKPSALYPEVPAHFLMVPGLGLGAEVWDPTIRGLVRAGVGRHRIEVATLPGYGEPVRRGDPRDPRGAALRLIETSLRAGERRVLVGHSSSCQVAVHSAALVPDRVVGLVLIGPTTDPREASWPGLIRRWLATAAHETPRQVPSLVRQYRRTGLLNMRRVMDTARRDRIEEMLQQARCQVLVVRGAHDRIAPQDWCSALAPTVTLPRGGHMVPITDGELVATAVRRFGETVATAR
jgi:pimeloyl-ACP methyl ester carboxylesterase